MRIADYFLVVPKYYEINIRMNRNVMHDTPLCLTVNLYFSPRTIPSKTMYRPSPTIFKIHAARSRIIDESLRNKSQSFPFDNSLRIVNHMKL